MRFWLLLIVFLISYGSLYPFDFSPAAGDFTHWESFFSGEYLSTALSDILGNIGLFLPFGMIGMFAFPRFSSRVAPAAVTFLLAFILAFSLQMAQIYLPSRSAALADVFWNLVGTVAGIIAGLAVGVQRTRRHPWRPASLVALGLLALWLAAELLPLVPTLDWQKFHDSLKPLLRGKFAVGETALQAAGLVLAGQLLTAVIDSPTTMKLLPVLAGMVLIGKLIIITQALDLSVVTGLVAGYLLWLALQSIREPRRSMTVFWLLLATYTAAALAPYTLASTPNPVNWIPFTALLQGSMLANVQDLMQSLVLFAGMLWLVSRVSDRIGAIGGALVFWITQLELIQIYIVGRTPDISEPLLFLVVLLVGRMIFTTVQDSIRKEAVVEEIGIKSAMPARRQPGEGLPSLAGAGIRLLFACGAIAMLMAVVLRLPNIPYNVRELFLGGGQIWTLGIFALALLWTGAGSAWTGQILVRSRLPFLVLPGMLLAVSLISLGLLSASVTQESLDDIIGSNNLYWFVTNKNIWGEWGRHLFLALETPEITGIIERLVRYMALYGPLILFQALTFAIFVLHRHKSLSMRRGLVLLISALPWLWLYKAIAFDWSSTDNLNELIARNGAFGLGGGVYLYALLIFLSVNTVTLVCIPRRVGAAILTALFTLAALPIGWYLLNAGLEPSVNKYDQVFSGVQFLLGPDREHKLSEITLFWRWTVVQIGFILVSATGIWALWPLLQVIAHRLYSVGRPGRIAAG